jgi:hypothetical protein
VLFSLFENYPSFEFSLGDLKGTNFPLLFLPVEVIIPSGLEISADLVFKFLLDLFIGVDA